MGVLRQDYLPADLKPLLDEAGVDGCVAVQASQSEEETRFLLQLAADHPRGSGLGRPASAECGRTFSAFFAEAPTAGNPSHCTG